jgi:hypothetical protein
MSSVLSGLVQTMAEERASDAPGWDIPLHSLFKFISKAIVSQHFIHGCRMTHNTKTLVSHHRSDSKNVDDPVYQLVRNYSKFCEVQDTGLEMELFIVKTSGQIYLILLF